MNSILSFRNIIFTAFLFFFSTHLFRAAEPDMDANSENIIFETKCGTFVKHNKQNRILDAYDEDSDARPINQTFVFSKSRLFKIHYDTVNLRLDRNHAVSLVDTDHNGIPDYVDSVGYYLEYAYHFYVDSIGYIDPVYPVSSGGTGYIDVYLLNIGNGVDPTYGLTYQDKFIYTKPNHYSFTSYILLDNDYSEKDSTFKIKKIDTNRHIDTLIIDTVIVYDTTYTYDTTMTKFRTYRETGMLAMKFTAAHELHHSVQMMNGYYDEANNILYEMTSTFMESRLYPETKDYYQFITALFKNISSYPFAYQDPYNRNGYCWAIYLKHLYYMYGDSIILRFWQLQREKDLRGYAALDAALKERNSNLVQSWEAFMPWIYYTGKRAKSGEYFPMAADFPIITPTDTVTFSSPASVFSNNELYNFEVNLYQYAFKSKIINKVNDTLHVIVSNIDTASVFSQREFATKSCNLITTDDVLQEEFRLGNSAYFYAYTFAAGCVSFKNFFNEGPFTVDLGYSYPNPFNPLKDPVVLFPVPAESIFGEKADLSIYSVDMVTVYSAEVTITDHNYHRVVALTSSQINSLESGVYIYSVKYKDTKTYGKFAIVNK